MRVFVAGHKGMVGSAIVRRLSESGVDILTCTRSEVDLRDQSTVRDYLQSTKPDAVILAAAKVGGIHANATFPADFIYDNLMMQTNVIHQSYAAGVEKLMFLGSSCIYPKDAAQPMREDALLTGVLEESNEPYAIAKIAGIKLCESYNRQYGVDYRSVMPTNLYGPGDNYHPQNSHVLPALMDRFHEAARNGAEEVTVWGSGTPRREFLHVDDMADAAAFVMSLPREIYARETSPRLSHINIGSGTDISIGDLATLIAQITGYRGKIRFDNSKPDGVMRKLMDVSRLERLGWRARISLAGGLRETYQWYLAQKPEQLRRS